MSITPILCLLLLSIFLFEEQTNWFETAIDVISTSNVYKQTLQKINNTINISKTNDLLYRKHIEIQLGQENSICWYLKKSKTAKIETRIHAYEYIYL